MVKRLTVNCTEHTGVLIKIMAVQIGKDKTMKMNEDVFNEICTTLKKYRYETGGIIGIDENGIISVFQFDNIQNPKMYEYYPNTVFLNKIINSEWKEKNIKFAGFVHSHLHNCKISPNDIEYARLIIKSNICIENILIGILDLSMELNKLTWTLIHYNYLKQINKIDMIHVEKEVKK